MKSKITETIDFPEGTECSFHSNVLTCKKNSHEVKKRLSYPLVKIEVQGNKIILSCEKGNKNQYKAILSMRAHIQNMIKGMDKVYTYELEACNVHFPMTLKIEGNILQINNFLGEKKQRRAKILPNVKVEIKGQKITVTSPDVEAAGQTAANFESATKIQKRDRRVYQDGIFITEKPGREL